MREIFEHTLLSKQKGNMGTIIRTAAGIGVDRILLTKGCVTPWSPKILRCSMGALFNVKIHDCLDSSQIKYFLSSSSHM